MMNKGKLIGGAVAASAIIIAIPLIDDWEGTELTPYYDIGGVLTVCSGETENVKLTDRYTLTECREMLARRVPDYYNGMAQHITRDDVPVKMLAAFTSFSYNVGVNAFKNSTLLRKLNAGDFFGACMELDRWVYDNGRVIKGLANRRKAEKALCLEGATNPTEIEAEGQGPEPIIEVAPPEPLPKPEEKSWFKRLIEHLLK